MYSTVIYGLLFGNTLANSKIFEIENLFVLGDSLSDNGGLAELMGHPQTIKYFYPNEKYTDGDVWVEFLNKKLQTKNFKNYAVAGATLNNEIAKAKTLDGRLVPGCIQQANQFVNELKNQENVSSRTTVATMIFSGNDFFHEGITPKIYMDNFRDCIEMVAKTGKVGTIIITKSIGTEFIPYFENHPYRKQLLDTEKLLVEELSHEIENFNKKNTDIQLFGLDYKEIIMEAKAKNKQLTPCMDMVLFDPPKEKPTVCEHPKDYIFYDKLHPTSYIHEIMAEKVFKFVYEKQSPIVHKCNTYLSN